MFFLILFFFLGNIYQPQRNANTYHPALRGGVPVFPPNIQQSPQVRRKAQPVPGGAQQAVQLNTPTQPDTRRRPMSFIRALEMTDQVEMNNSGPPQYHPNNQQLGGQGGGQGRPGTPDRTSVYDMNYEISV